jgi:hypothetical protein
MSPSENQPENVCHSFAVIANLKGKSPLLSLVFLLLILKFANFESTTEHRNSDCFPEIPNHQVRQFLNMPTHNH